jgi:hypothetical protein
VTLPDGFQLWANLPAPIAIVSSLNYNLITGVEEDKGTVISFRRRRGV